MYKYLFLLLVVSLGAFAGDKTEGVEYRPVNFIDGDKSLQSRIIFPEWEGDITVTLRCDAGVHKFGTIKKENFCFTKNDEYQVFAKAVMDAAEYSKLEPALVKGKRKSIWFQYLVTFHKKDGKKMIVLYPNYGLDMDKYGPYYTSAQRYSSGVRTYFNRCRLLNTNIWVKAKIDEFGKAHDVEAISSEKGGERCAKNIAYKLKKGKFIPAMNDGKPVPSLYTESFFNIYAANKLNGY
ncbi:MAG: energy transducer TonB [Agarilytica sp.]